MVDDATVTLNLSASWLVVKISAEATLVPSNLFSIISTNHKVLLQLFSIQIFC